MRARDLIEALISIPGYGDDSNPGEFATRSSDSIVLLSDENRVDMAKIREAYDDATEWPDSAQYLKIIDKVLGDLKARYPQAYVEAQSHLAQSLEDAMTQIADYHGQIEEEDRIFVTCRTIAVLIEQSYEAHDENEYGQDPAYELVITELLTARQIMEQGLPNES